MSKLQAQVLFWVATAAGLAIIAFVGWYFLNPVFASMTEQNARDEARRAECVMAKEGRARVAPEHLNDFRETCARLGVRL